MNISAIEETSDTGTFAALQAKSDAAAGTQPSVLVALFERWTSRKFAICVFLEVASTVAAFTHIIEGGTWLAFGTLVLGTYCGATVADKHLNGGAG